MQAVKTYKAAIAWSLTISTCVIMEGYDTNLLGNFFAYPTFQKQFGNTVPITKSTPSGYQLVSYSPAYCIHILTTSRLRAGRQVLAKPAVLAPSLAPSSMAGLCKHLDPDALSWHRSSFSHASCSSCSSQRARGCCWLVRSCVASLGVSLRLRHQRTLQRFSLFSCVSTSPL